jgi:hypothetical protein
MKNLALILAAVAALAGCAKVDKTPTPPAYVKLYPGATQAKLDVADLWTTEVFTTHASQSDIVAFYRAQASANGIPEDTTATPSPYAQPNSKEVTFNDPATGRMFKLSTEPTLNAPSLQQMGVGLQTVVLSWKTPGAAE